MALRLIMDYCRVSVCVLELSESSVWMPPVSSSSHSKCVQNQITYSRTTPQRPSWEQRKLAPVRRWPLQGGGGNMAPVFFGDAYHFCLMATWPKSCGHSRWTRVIVWIGKFLWKAFLCNHSLRNVRFLWRVCYCLMSEILCQLWSHDWIWIH